MVKQNMVIKGILIFLVYSASFLLSGVVNWPFQLCTVSIATLLVCWYYIGREKFYITAITILPSYLLYAFDTVSKGLIHVYPIVVFPPLIVAISLLVNLKNKIPRKWIYITLLLVFTLPTYMGMSLWLAFESNKEYANDINSKFPELTLMTADGGLIQFPKNNDNVMVLDFWSTNCGNCFRAFPHMQKTKEEYANLPVRFYTVNIPISRDTLQKTKTLIEKYFDQNLFITNTSTISALNLKAVPLYMVIKNNIVLFKGHVSATRIALENDLPDEIDNALNINITKE